MFPPGGVFPPGTTDIEKRSIATRVRSSGWLGLRLCVCGWLLDWTAQLGCVATCPALAALLCCLPHSHLTPPHPTHPCLPQVPEWDSTNCTQCNICSFVCPHAAIRPVLATPEELGSAPAGFHAVPIKGGGPALKGLQYRIQVRGGCGLLAAACI